MGRQSQGRREGMGADAEDQARGGAAAPVLRSTDYARRVVPPLTLPVLVGARSFTGCLVVFGIGLPLARHATARGSDGKPIRNGGSRVSLNY